MSSKGSKGSKLAVNKAGSASKTKKNEPATGSNPQLSSDEELKKIRDELKLEKEERNFFQQERDRINTFWEITKQELDRQKAELLNKDREIEEIEEKHQVEIKVYKQKVKHLLYEYQNNVSHLQLDSEKALQLEREEYMHREQDLKKDKNSLKSELREFELAHEDLIKTLKQKHDDEITKMRLEFENKIKELHVKYEKKMKISREELEIKRKNEIHEIEERKNGQINTLMKNHDKAFTEIKNYYNDITLNNLALINSLKEQVEEMKKKEERNEKIMAEVMSENKRLSEPLHAALNECEVLKKQVQNYEKDKMALRNTKGRLKMVEEQFKDLEWEHEVLKQRFSQVEKERDEIKAKFVEKLVSIQQKTGLKSMILEKKVQTLKSDLEKKEALLKVDASVTSQEDKMKARKDLEQLIDSKNSEIKKLQIQIAQIRV